MQSDFREKKGQYTIKSIVMLLPKIKLEFYHQFVYYRGVQLTIEIQSSSEEASTFEKFVAKLNGHPCFVEKKTALKNEILAFIKPFPLPGLHKGC